jgi:hypothetical protein
MSSTFHVCLHHHLFLLPEFNTFLSSISFLEMMAFQAKTVDMDDDSERRERESGE